MVSKKIIKVITVFMATFAFIPKVVFAQDITLRILCWEGYAKPYTKKFQALMHKKYDKKVSLEIKNVSDPGEFWDESRGNNVDLISPAHNILKSNKWKFIEGKIALPINLKNIPNYKYVIPFLQKNEFATKNGKVFGVPYTMGPYGLAYNADKVEEPESWNILWSKEAKNKITISKDYSDCNIYTSVLALGGSYNDLYDYDTLVSNIDKISLSKKLSKLVSNTFSLWEGTADYKQFDQLLYAATWGYAVAQANKHGGNWKMATPKEGTTMWVDHWVITHSLKDKPLKKKIAEEWINYCLSNDLQIGVIRNWGVSPVVTNINDKLTKDEIAVYKPGQNEYWKNLSLWKNQSTRTQNAFKIIWDSAKR